MNARPVTFRSILGDSHRVCLLAALAVAAVALLPYLQTVTFGCVLYDDNDYVLMNPWVRQGLTFPGIRWAFTSVGHLSNWHPLTWLSLMGDVTLFGIRPGAIHLVNAMLHAGAAALLCLVLVRLTGSVPGAMVAAAFWALHPLRVESVAWISQRKDVLCGFWSHLALLLYVFALKPPVDCDESHRGETQGVGRIGPEALRMAAAGCFGMALLAKPTPVMLPALLLVLNLAFTGSLQFRRIDTFLWLALVSAGVTLYAQDAGGAVVNMQRLPLLPRLGNAMATLGVYLRQTVWPDKLAVYYPFRWPPPVGRLYGGLAVCTALGAGAVYVLFSPRVRRSGSAWKAHAFNPRSLQPYAAGVLWFFLAPLPMLGLVQVGGQGHADRYTYWPAVGLALAMAWGWMQMEKRLRTWRVGLRALAGVILVLVGVAATRQAARWRDTETLFTRALAVTERNYVAHNNLGIFYCQRGEPRRGVEELRLAATYDPCPRQVARLALGLLETEELEEAAELAKAAREQDPREATAWLVLGVVAYKREAYVAAANLVRQAVKLSPADAEGWAMLGNALAKQGLWREAVPAWQQALRLNPTLEDARENLSRHGDKLQRTAAPAPDDVFGAPW